MFHVHLSVLLPGDEIGNTKITEMLKHELCYKIYLDIVKLNIKSNFYVNYHK